MTGDTASISLVSLEKASVDSFWSKRKLRNGCWLSVSSGHSGLWRPDGFVDGYSPCASWITEWLWCLFLVNLCWALHVMCFRCCCTRNFWHLKHCSEYEHPLCATPDNILDIGSNVISVSYYVGSTSELYLCKSSWGNKYWKTWCRLGESLDVHAVGCEVAKNMGFGIRQIWGWESYRCHVLADDTE